MANTRLQHNNKKRLYGKSQIIYWLRLIITDLLQKRFNKKIYTKILFSNVMLFVVNLIIMMILSGFIVKQATNVQLQQDLLRKAKRINYVLQQLTDQRWDETSDITKRAGIHLESARQDWEKAQILFRIRAISKIEYDKTKAVYERATDVLFNAQNQAKQEQLKFLADLFNAKRITIFNKAGNVIGAFAEQKVALNSKVEKDCVAALNRGEIEIFQAVDRKTRRPIFKAVVPIRNNQNVIENGVLLEIKSSGLDANLKGMHLYFIIVGMVILVVIIIISVCLGMSISRPIFLLTANIAEISRGNDVLSFESQSFEEINVLADKLNKLAVRYQKIQTESSRMEEERARLFTEISHELRTPLTSVQGFVEAIRDGMVRDKTLLERYLDTIYTQTVHITRLVDDILALGRLESGNITIEKQPLDLVALIQNVVMSFEAEANSRNTSLLLDKKTEKAIVLGDFDRMEQIVRNLLKNAIVATENGTILVGVDVIRSEVLLTIQDDGIGIAAEDLPHIWERFFRVKNRRGSQIKEKGTGLGLVIVKKLVQLQGGIISVKSQTGKGTSFRICFPLHK